MKELSAGQPSGTGARRAAIALTAGFGAGPLLAAPLAQWWASCAPLPYLVHMALAAASLALLPNAPETLPVDATRPHPPLRRRLRPTSATSPRFTRVVVPMAPCVFGSVTLVFSTLPAHAAGPVAGLDVAFSGVLATIALGAGLAVQPIARRLDNATAVRRAADSAVLGLTLITAGCLAGAAATARPGALVVILATLLPGGGYGMCLVSGLREVERLAPPNELAGLLAIYYVLCYSGLASPYLLALAATSLGLPSRVVDRRGPRAAGARLRACPGTSRSRVQPTVTSIGLASVRGPGHVADEVRGRGGTGGAVVDARVNSEPETMNDVGPETFSRAWDIRVISNCAAAVAISSSGSE